MNESIVNQCCHEDDDDDFWHTNKALLGGVGSTYLPPVEDHSTLHVTNTMLQLFQEKDIFRRLDL